MRRRLAKLQLAFATLTLLFSMSEAAPPVILPSPVINEVGMAIGLQRSFRVFIDSDVTPIFDLVSTAVTLTPDVLPQERLFVVGSFVRHVVLTPVKPGVGVFNFTVSDDQGGSTTTQGYFTTCCLEATTTAAFAETTAVPLMELSTAALGATVTAFPEENIFSTQMAEEATSLPASSTATSGENLFSTQAAETATTAVPDENIFSTVSAPMETTGVALLQESSLVATPTAADAASSFAAATASTTAALQTSDTLRFEQLPLEIEAVVNVPYSVVFLVVLVEAPETVLNGVVLNAFGNDDAIVETTAINATETGAANEYRLTFIPLSEGVVGLTIIASDPAQHVGIVSVSVNVTRAQTLDDVCQGASVQALVPPTGLVLSLTPASDFHIVFPAGAFVTSTNITITECDVSVGTSDLSTPFDSLPVGRALGAHVYRLEPVGVALLVSATVYFEFPLGDIDVSGGGGVYYSSSPWVSSANTTVVTVGAQPPFVTPGVNTTVSSITPATLPSLVTVLVTPSLSTQSENNPTLWIIVGACIVMLILILLLIFCIILPYFYKKRTRSGKINFDDPYDDEKGMPGDPTEEMSVFIDEHGSLQHGVFNANKNKKKKKARSHTRDSIPENEIALTPVALGRDLLADEAMAERIAARARARASIDTLVDDDWERSHDDSFLTDGALPIGNGSVLDYIEEQNVRRSVLKSKQPARETDWQGRRLAGATPSDLDNIRAFPFRSDMS